MGKRRRSPLDREHVETSMCSRDLKLRIIRGLPFLSSLDHGAINSVSGLFREEGFTVGQMIYLAESPATHLYVVAFGKVKLIHQTELGRSIILDVLSQGEFFGRFSPSSRDLYPSSARAQTSACTLVMSNRDFQEILIKYPAVSLDLLKAVSARLETAQDTIRRLSSDPADRRIASVLLRLANKLGRQKDSELLIQLTLSREDLADMSGTTTETASRVVSALQRKGLIQAGRKWVSVVDLERLSAAAGDTNL
jgi:CRP-like cAMP-binding protein